MHTATSEITENIHKRLKKIMSRTKSNPMFKIPAVQLLAMCHPINLQISKKTFVQKIISSILLENDRCFLFEKEHRS